MKKLLLFLSIAVVTAGSVKAISLSERQAMEARKQAIQTVSKAMSYVQKFTDMVCIISAGLTADSLLHDPTC